MKFEQAFAIVLSDWAEKIKATQAAQIDHNAASEMLSKASDVLDKAFEAEDAALDNIHKFRQDVIDGGYTEQDDIPVELIPEPVVVEEVFELPAPEASPVEAAPVSDISAPIVAEVAEPDALVAETTEAVAEVMASGDESEKIDL